jgi:hypothetical protein
MKLFARFRRPLWEHPEPLHRAEAVRSETAPELVKLLPQIAASDTAAEVRRAAIARIDSADVLLGLLAAEKDSGCRDAILGRVRARLLDAKSPTEERLRLASHPQLPAELAETLAESAPEAELREAALLRLNKPGLLQRRCLKDPDPALRLRLLDQIADEAALDRIAEAARGQDKALSRRAREKADALKLARGDAGAINQRALQLGAAFDARTADRCRGPAGGPACRSRAAGAASRHRSSEAPAGPRRQCRRSSGCAEGRPPAQAAACRRGDS